jgi:hypothetical protein
MPRWIPPESRMILQAIADDERRPAHEREAARRELANGESPSKPSLRRRNRNSNLPMTQQDQDADLTTALTFRPSETSSDRIEIEAGMDDSTRAILAAFGSCLLWLFDNNAEEIRILIDLHRRTQSESIRDKATKTIRWIADYSTNEAAKAEAQQCL